MNFTYLPVNHVNATTGDYECEIDGEDVDCDSTKYDACTVDIYGDTEANRRRISAFLACFEGPFANRETTVNASRRPACFAAAGLDIAPVEACRGDAARVGRLEKALNVSKGAMMAGLGPDPGYFPHIFLDGAPLAGRSWTALTRRVCDALEGASPAFCGGVSRRLAFSVDSAAIRAGGALDAAVRTAIDVATSRYALPRHFDTDDDGLPPGDPSYVDVRAASSASCVVEAATAICGYSVLAAFGTDTAAACDGGAFADALVYGLVAAAGLRVNASDVVVHGC